MADRQKAIEAAEAANQSDAKAQAAANSHLQIPLMLTAGPGGGMPPPQQGYGPPPPGYGAGPTGYAPGYGQGPGFGAPPTGYGPGYGSGPTNGMQGPPGYGM